MLISKRRLRWSAITLLIVCLALLLRPTRGWIDRLLVTRLVGPQISVGELLIHSQQSIVEARDLCWTGSRESRSFQLTARRGWFAYDQLGLVDRHTRLPKVLLQNANLRLDPVPPTPAAEIEQWKQLLAQKITQLDWEHIQQKFGCLITTKELKSRWSASIERWVSRSRQILTEAAELERQTVSMDNPLRYEVSIQEKLGRLRELANEQSLISKQFDNLSQQLESEAVKLHDLHRQDHLKFAGLVIGNSATNDLQLESDRLCLELAQDLGQAFWQRISAYGEIVDHLAWATRGTVRPSYDIDVRSHRHGNERLKLDDWKAIGEFTCGARTAPYQASGTWSLTQDPLLASRLEFDWNATFDPAHARIDVHAESASRQSDASTQLVVLHTPAAAKKFEPGPHQADGSRNQHPAPASRLSLASHQGVLHGELTLIRDSLHWLAIDTDDESAPSRISLALAPFLQNRQTAQSAPDQPLRFKLDGHWTQANLKLQGPIPEWLTQAVAAEVNERAQQASEASRLLLDREFNAGLAQLRHLVATALSDSKTLADTHERQLLAAQGRLQKLLDDMHGTEFARRPGALNR